MATTPRRWPVGVEAERVQALEEALTVVQHLITAQDKMDIARSKINANPGLVILLLSEADRATSDALAGMERIQRCFIVCKGKDLDGRWPSVAARQRDDALLAAQQASGLLVEAQDDILQVMEKARNNPGLVEIMIVDIARKQAKSRVLAERIARLMTEAAIGRE